MLRVPEQAGVLVDEERDPLAANHRGRDQGGEL
jgi:hypothetical protein